MDFVQTMNDWRRMCAVYSTDEDDCCKGCPMLDLDFDEHGCDAIFSDWSKAADWKKVEDTINEWAAEHPEPVYPTWAEYLTAIGVIEHDALIGVVFGFGKTVCDCIYEKNIPADIAEKLGLQPKNG